MKGIAMDTSNLREIDALVAEKVMGFVWDETCCRICGWPKPVIHKVKNGCVDGNCWQRPAPARRADEPPYYSADIAAAWLVVEKMRERGAAFVLGSNGCAAQVSAWFTNGIWALAKNQNRVPERGDPHLLGVATADTAPLAICRAALQSVNAEAVKK